MIHILFTCSVSEKNVYINGTSIMSKVPGSGVLSMTKSYELDSTICVCASVKLHIQFFYAVTNLKDLS